MIDMYFKLINLVSTWSDGCIRIVSGSSCCSASLLQSDAPPETMFSDFPLTWWCWCGVTDICSDTVRQEVTLILIVNHLNEFPLGALFNREVFPWVNLGPLPPSPSAWRNDILLYWINYKVVSRCDMVSGHNLWWWWPGDIVMEWPVSQHPVDG